MLRNGMESTLWSIPLREVFLRTLIVSHAHVCIIYPLTQGFCREETNNSNERTKIFQKSEVTPRTASSLANYSVPPP